MAFRLFRKKKDNGSDKEKSHREPIIVKIFKDDKSQTQVNISEVNEGPTEDEEDDLPKKKVRFAPNQKYFTVSMYALGVIAVTILMVVFVFKIRSVLSFLSGVLSALGVFLAAALIAFIMAPLVKALDESFFEKLLKIKNEKVRMTFSIIISYAVLLGLLVFGLIQLIPEVVASIMELLSRSKQLYAAISEFLSTLSERFPEIDFTFISEKLQEFVPSAISYVTEFIKSFVPKLFSASYAVVRGLINALLTIAISIYMVCDKRRIAHKATQLSYIIMSPKKAPRFITVVKECGQIFFGFIIGKALDSLIIGLITLGALTIFKMPYALLVSVFVGITNMIPFFGPFIGAIPGILLYLVVDPVYALIFGIMILVIQQFDGWLLGPMILGDSTGIRPIWVIFGITIGGAYFSVLGMFLGVPVTAVLVYLCDLWIDKALKRKGVEVS